MAPTSPRRPPTARPRPHAARPSRRIARPLVWWLALSAPSAAAAPPGRTAAWVELTTPASAEALRALNLPVEDAGGPDRVRVWLTEADRAALAALGLRTTSAPTPPPEPGLSPEAVEEALRALVAQAPGLTALVELGRSVEGRPIWGLRLGHGARARWRVLGAHHGDEASSVDLALATAVALVERSADDPAVAELLERDEVWVVPIVNPDGVAANTRTNALGVDLNRNYGEQWREAEWASGASAFSEPETRAVRMWASTRGFVGGLSMHSGAANLGWVWNWTTARSPDEALLRAIAEDYAALAEVPGFWLTNGADWYRTYGDTTDWAYARQGTLDFTLEVSEQKSPPRAELPAIIDAHIDAVIGFLTQPGVAAGAVLDAETGRPVPATLRLIDGGAIFTSDIAGRFARILGSAEAEVEVEVEVSSPGYVTQRARLQAEASQTLRLAPVQRCAGRLILGPDGALSGEGIDAPEGPATLHRFGEPSIPVDLDDPEALAALDLLPGPIDVERGGVLCPRALWTAGDIADQLDVELDVLDGDLVLSLPEGSAAPTAYLFYGPDRAWSPVQLRAEGPGRFRLSAASLPSGEPNLDLLVFSGGRAAAVLRVDDEAALLTGGTAEDVAGPSRRWSADKLSPYACAMGPRSLPGAILVSLIALLLRRRSP